ncbi:WD40-repeat-containing domain protein [Ochromonadaceae sp. CCMP2298]|nr:WD40-repeat-containing domain protein [Ochromonadaceae sp. CCMP2298]
MLSGESSYPNSVPEVYVQWRLQRRQQVPGAYLSVKLGPRPAEMMPVLLAGLGSELATSSVEGQKLADALVLVPGAHYTGRRGKLWAGINGAPKSKAELTRLRSALLKRTRGHREPCVVPDKLVGRLDVGGEGAMVVSFSNSGHILAVAAKTTDAAAVPLSTDATTYSLVLYDTDLSEQVWVEEAAHHGVIYEIKWTKDDRYLLTCSGDGTCKVWDMLPVAYRSSNTMGFGALSSSVDLASQAAATDPSGAAAVLHSASNRPPTLVHTLTASPPVYTYCGVFCDHPRAGASTGAGGPDLPDGGSLANSVALNPGLLSSIYASTTAIVPRIITGGADGKLRVWDGSSFLGYVHVTRKDEEADAVDYSPHEGQVNSIVIDERSRYMISADSAGDILAWRYDAKGWYQLLRKFKRDVPVPGGVGMPGQANSGGGVLFLAMHPDKHKGQMLTLHRQPAQLKVINMSTYKTHCVCAGFGGYASSSNTGGLFNRASLSADGRYAVAGSSVKGEEGLYRLQVWDSGTGRLQRSPLSGMMFPYPVRSISWHPSQHLLAVAMVGQGAAVAIYSGDRENADRTIERMQNDSQAQAAPPVEPQPLPQATSKPAPASTPAKKPFGFASLVPAPSPAQPTPTSTSGTSGTSGMLNSDKAREMLDRIRAAKAARENR